MKNKITLITLFLLFAILLPVKSLALVNWTAYQTDCEGSNPQAPVLGACPILGSGTTNNIQIDWGEGPTLNGDTGPIGYRFTGYWTHPGEPGVESKILISMYNQGHVGWRLIINEGGYPGGRYWVALTNTENGSARGSSFTGIGGVTYPFTMDYFQVIHGSYAPNLKIYYTSSNTPWPTADNLIPDSHFTLEAPPVSGSPATLVDENTSYTFTPQPVAELLSPVFSIENKPSWATFNTTTGQLSGTAVEGVYPDIVITLTQLGGSTYSLPSFTITVEDVPLVDSEMAQVTMKIDKFAEILSIDNIQLLYIDGSGANNKEGAANSKYSGGSLIKVMGSGRMRLEVNEADFNLQHTDYATAQEDQKAFYEIKNDMIYVAINDITPDFRNNPSAVAPTALLSNHRTLATDVNSLVLEQLGTTTFYVELMVLSQLNDTGKVQVPGSYSGTLTVTVLENLE